MYVPPYEALVRSLDTTPSAVASAKGVVIPGALLKLLLQWPSPTAISMKSAICAPILT